jgi:hypothetical protein
LFVFAKKLNVEFRFLRLSAILLLCVNEYFSNRKDEKDAKKQTNSVLTCSVPGIGRMSAYYLLFRAGQNQQLERA